MHPKIQALNWRTRWFVSYLQNFGYNGEDSENHLTGTMIALYFMDHLNKSTRIRARPTIGRDPLQHDMGFQKCVSDNQTCLVLALIPLLIAFFIAQRHFIQGIVLTGVKG